MTENRQRGYSDAERAEIVARIVAGESIRSVAEDCGVPYSTVQEWHSRASAAGQSAANPAYDHAALWGEASALASRLIRKTLTRYADEDRDIAPRELQNIAIVGGISTDKHLDYRDGRTKGGVNIDNRQVHVQLSAEQAAALIAEAQRRGALLPAPSEDQPPPSTTDIA